MSIDELVAATVARVIREEVPAAVRRAMADNPRASGNGEYLTPEKAADVADVHIDTVRLWLKDGKLPTHWAGKRKRVLRSDLEQLMAAGPLGQDDEGPSSDEIAARALAKREGKP
jgi:excisionase family DNA binding protein